MSQFGADTTIDSRVRLLILDCFDTLVELGEDGSYHPRKGVEPFLRHYGHRIGLPLVVLSDAEQVHLEAVLHSCALATWFSGVYGAPRSVEQREDGRLLKRLDVALADQGIAAGDCIFIGDSPLDALAAQNHGLRSIRVPGSADRDFSMEQLIEGPSRYHSAEYTTRMLRRYRRDQDQEDPP
jgi:phosphoglycolate phosphatase-like HAD superfamily hydrolase